MLPITMPTGSRLSRIVCGVLLAAALLGGPSGALAAPGPNPAPPQAAPPKPQPAPPQANQPAAAPAQPPVWAVTLSQATLYSGATDQALAFGDIPPQVPMQVLGYQGDYAHIYVPRTRTEAYIRSDLIGPSDTPSPYLTMAPPPLSDEFDARGVVTDSAQLALYPTSADEAVDGNVHPNTWLNLTGVVSGDDGTRWYRTDTGDFVPAEAVFVPARTEDFTGRWLDVNLNTPARVTAYEGDTVVDSFLTIKGAGPRPTPTGVFTILRRVANETMNSDTIGIPRFGPGGYYLTNVLFTQYFTGDGASFHYNYWSSAWGYAGSHGCLGLSYANSAWLWEWAHVGTPVVIHY